MTPSRIAFWALMAIAAVALLSYLLLVMGQGSGESGGGMVPR